MEIKAVAKGSMDIRITTEAFVFQIRQMMEQLEFIEVQIEGIVAEIKAYMTKLNSPITTTPRIGPVYGAVILSELGDIRRYTGENQIISYAGLDASVNESVGSNGDQYHISK